MFAGRRQSCTAIWLLAVMTALLSMCPRAEAGGTQNYEASQNPEVTDPKLHSLNEYLNETDELSPLGLRLRAERRGLKYGGEAEGLLIVSITPGSPAANAGLHAYNRTTKNILEGAAIGASLVFPPAIFAIALFDPIPFGESYDLIIGVDASRVTNFLDFESQVRDVRPGEIVYLNIVRDGSRLQVPVQVPALLP